MATNADRLTALAATIDPMTEHGAALVELALTLAAVLDAPGDHERSVASVAKEYRAVLADLAAMRGDAHEEAPDVGLTGLAEVRDAPQPRPTDARRRGRSGGRDPGAAVVALAAPRR